MENFNLETLEKGIKKRSRIRNLLIVLVILLALYTVIIAGDISSAKTKEKNRHATEMAELDTAVEDRKVQRVHRRAGSADRRAEGQLIDRKIRREFTALWKESIMG